MVHALKSAEVHTQSEMCSQGRRLCNWTFTGASERCLLLLKIWQLWLDGCPGSADERAAAQLTESVMVILVCQETQDHWYLFLSKFYETYGSSRELIASKATHYLQVLYFSNPNNFLSTGYGFIVFLFCFAFFFLLHSNLNHFSGVKGRVLDLLSPAEMEKHPGNIGCLLQFLCFQLQVYLVSTQNVFIYAGTSAKS